MQLDVPASCIAFGAGGAWGLAGQDDDVQILNLKSGKRLQRFRDHDDPVTSVALALDGEFALSADESGMVLYWELLTRKRKKRLKGHRRAVRAVALSQQSQLALTGSDDGTTRLWSLTTGKEYSLEESDWEEKVTAVAFARGGELVAVGGGKGHVNVWDSRSGERLRWFETAKQPIGSVGFSSDGKSVLAVARPLASQAAYHPQVWRWDIKTGQPQECFRKASPATCVPALAVLDHASKGLIVAGTRPAQAAFLKGEPSLEVWNLGTGACQHAFSDMQAVPVSLALAPENTRFLVALTDRRVQVFTLPGT
jgi:WD40 repeat protein